MRFSEFKELLFVKFFEPFEVEGIKYNESECDALTYKFEDFMVINDRLINDGVDNELLDRIMIYQETFNNMKSGDTEELIPRSVEDTFLFDCGQKRSATVPREKVKGMSFYTIVPYKRLPFNEGEVSRIRECAKKIFQNKKFIKFSHFCVESGKHKKKPNLHIHCICNFQEGASKNFARFLQNTWKSFYPEKRYNITYKEIGKNGKYNTGIDRVPCNTQKIIEDKMNYMENSLKGSHKNFVDLKISEIFNC